MATAAAVQARPTFTGAELAEKILWQTSEVVELTKRFFSGCPSRVTIALWYRASAFRAFRKRTKRCCILCGTWCTSFAVKRTNSNACSE